MTLKQFIDKYTGKTKGYPTDKDYSGECLSIVKIYMKEMFGFNPPPSGSNSAYGYWSNFPAPLGEYFTKIADKKGIVPAPGDVIIWNTNTGGGFGHIAICVSSDVASTEFTSFDQNYYGRHAHIQKHNYSNVVGWLHPRSTITPMPDTIPVDKKTFEELVNKATLMDSIKAAGVTSASDVDALKQAIIQAQQERGTALEEAKKVRNESDTYKSQVAEKLQSAQDLPRVLSAIDDLMKKMEAATVQAQNDANENRTYEAQIVELKAEILRLQTLLKSDNPLSEVTLNELLQELLRRFSQILGSK